MPGFKDTPIAQYLVRNVCQNVDRRAQIRNLTWKLLLEIEDAHRELEALEEHDVLLETEFARLEDNPELLDNQAIADVSLSIVKVWSDRANDSRTSITGLSMSARSRLSSTKRRLVEAKL